MYLTLSPGVSRFKNTVFEKNWKVTDLSTLGGERKSYLRSQDSSPEPLLLESYFENSEGKTIFKPKKNESIFLVIKTQNMTGKKINIDLSDDEIDYEYNGKHLENDLLEEIDITADTLKLSLKTLKQRT
jgi:hypothetical protein